MAGDSEKRTPWWNQEVKEAIRAKKDAFKAWLQDRSSSDLQSRYTEARKAATSAVEKSKEKSWEEFGRRLDSNYFSVYKVFWQTICRLRGKRSSVTYSIKDSAGNILTDASKSTLAPLFILQKIRIRLLTGSGYREHTNPLFYRAKCLKLKDIYSLETSKLMYKIHNNVLSFVNSDKFNLIKNCYTHKTRLSHKNNFFLPRTRTRLGQKFLSFAGIKVWNEIPSSMKEVSFYRFKKAVKGHFLSNYETDKS